MPEFEPSTLAAFAAASVLLAITPGPAVLYIVACTLARGRAAGLASVAGVGLGNLGNALGASIGLAALFAVSSLAFSVVKYAGAAYLVYLGIRALRRGAAATAQPATLPTLKWVFRDAFVVALLNPKTALFFAAFLPQFMNPGASAASQGMLLAVLFVSVALLTDTVYVLCAGALAARFAGSGDRAGGGRLGRYATAATFIGLGLFTAASGSRAAR